jgi:hypothetical protein
MGRALHRDGPPPHVLDFGGEDVGVPDVQRLITAVVAGRTIRAEAP